jgi:two-component system cell cycle sensor histidine kinase/response regulator CckA
MDGTLEINPARILLVEDEALVCAMICDALLEHGFEVHAVGNAGDALKYLREGAPVDVLFTDINLPGEMDGAILAQQARAMRPDLPVVFASGRWAMLDRLRTMPGTVCLPKPYSLERACAVVDQLVATRH